jgi:L-malate glycosyltransferase
VFAPVRKGLAARAPRGVTCPRRRLSAARDPPEARLTTPRPHDADLPLTVLHVDTERGWRGGERQAFWLARELARRGHRSVVAARPDEPLAARAADAGLEVVPLSPLAEFDPVAVLRLRRAARALGAHVMHAHTGHAVGLAALAARGTGVRIVVTRRVDFRLGRGPATRWKYRRAHALIAISRAVADAMAASGLPRERIEIIPSGVDLSRTFTPATRETLAALGVPPGAPLVVQVAQLVGHKDPLTFVRAIAAARRAVPALHALLVGDGHLRPAVDALVAALALGDALHATGYRTDADALLAAADVATLSSEEEGLGTVLLDAMSMGKPVAATRAGGIPEIVADGASGLLAPVHDAEALGANIARLLSDAPLRSALSAGARARAAEFSVERTAERTLAVYRRALVPQVPAGSSRPSAAR